MLRCKSYKHNPKLSQDQQTAEHQSSTYVIPKTRSGRTAPPQHHAQYQTKRSTRRAAIANTVQAQALTGPADTKTTSGRTAPPAARPSTMPSICGKKVVDTSRFRIDPNATHELPLQRLGPTPAAGHQCRWPRRTLRPYASQLTMQRFPMPSVCLQCQSDWPPREAPRASGPRRQRTASHRPEAHSGPRRQYRAHPPRRS